MTALPTLFLTCLFFASAVSTTQCNKNSQATQKTNDTLISKIRYRSTGGRGGNYESLDISPDSLRYVQARRGNEKLITEKTVQSDWNGLVKTIRLTDFAKIKSNPGHALYDGIDITHSIEKGEEKYSVVNGAEDTVNYKKIKPFADLLDKKLSELRSKVTW